VGFASLIPGLIYDLLKAVKAGNLHEAMRIQSLITPLKDAVYGGGEPTGEAHGRMQGAMALAGILRDGTVRPPTHAPNAQQLAAIKSALEHAGMLKRAAA